MQGSVSQVDVQLRRQALAHCGTVQSNDSTPFKPTFLIAAVTKRYCLRGCEGLRPLRRRNSGEAALQLDATGQANVLAQAVAVGERLCLWDDTHACRTRSCAGNVAVAVSARFIVHVWPGNLWCVLDTGDTPACISDAHTSKRHLYFGVRRSLRCATPAARLRLEVCIPCWRLCPEFSVSRECNGD